MLCPALDQKTTCRDQKTTCSHCPKITAKWDMDKLLLVMERAKGVFKALDVDGYRAKAAELNIIDLSNTEDFAKLNIQAKKLSGLEECVLRLLLVGVLSKQEIARIVGISENTIISDVLSRGLFRYAEIIAEIPEKKITRDNFRTFMEEAGFRKVSVKIKFPKGQPIDPSLLEAMKLIGNLPTDTRIDVIYEEGDKDNE